MATNTRQNERAPKAKRPLSEVWKSTKMTPVEKVMLWLGWVPADITRHITCTWCGADFAYTGKVTDDPPRFCTETHKRASVRERAKRLAELNAPRTTEPAAKMSPGPNRKKPDTRPAGHKITPPKVKSKCRCHGHTGKPKAKYRTNASAANGLMSRHLKYANGRIYQCPTSSYWHITTQMERKVAP